MCGIAGYLGQNRISRQRLESCLRRMGRRGPDTASGYYSRSETHGHVHLLHTRLSIIDLDERSDQPFRRGSQVLVYNGELYNYLELRRELEKAGEALRTAGDTEVLAAALARWGPEGLDRCEGMWAFACYDEGTGELLLSRDRFGEKPLVFYRDESGLYFGSEAKFVFALLGRVLPVRFDQLYRYMVNGYKALYKGRPGFFEGLEELPPASVMRLRDGEETACRYWRPAFEVDEDLDYGAAVEAVREALVRSVRLRLRADVPLAFCLSGGIDSNALVAIARRVLDYDVEGFTIMNTDERYDERELVELSVRELGIRHHPVPVSTADFLPRLRELVRYHDAPVYTISHYAQWLLMRAIGEKGYRISVSGTAADELFSGYYDHHNAYLYEVRGDPERYQTALADWHEHIQPWVRNPYLKEARLFVDDPGFRDHIFLDADGFARYLKCPWGEPFTEERYTSGLLRNRMANELFHEAVPAILHEEDRNAMYFSIENRSPFLDRELFELAQRIPTRHLVQRGYAKVVLRDAVRGIAPDAVLDSHRKVGFNAPIYSFLDVTDPNVRASVLDQSPIFEHVRRDKIEELIMKQELPNSQSKFLFYFLNSKIFLEELSGQSHASH